MEKSPEFYKQYPALFYAYFPTISTDTVRLLCDAGYTYYNSILCLDALIDDRNALFARKNNQDTHSYLWL